MNPKILIIVGIFAIMIALGFILVKEVTYPIKNENEALNYVLYRFPEFKTISKCEFEEKLMCHEDIIVEKVNGRWNVTFMNESKECNNECVIRHYYSFFG